MPSYEYKITIAVEAGGVAVRPCDSGATLTHDLVDGDVGAQAIVATIVVTPTDTGPYATKLYSLLDNEHQ